MQKPPILSGHANAKPIGESYYEDGTLHIRLNHEGLKLMEQIKHPPIQDSTAWVGLTDEEILAELPVTTSRPATSFARAIEAKLREKNGF
jgi:hypothetical protein